MIIGAVPLYNIAAVLVLTLMRPGRGRLERALLKKTFWDVASNPILIGILVGILWSLLRIPQPVIFQKTLSNFAEMCIRDSSRRFIWIPPVSVFFSIALAPPPVVTFG